MFLSSSLYIQRYRDSIKGGEGGSHPMKTFFILCCIPVEIQVSGCKKPCLASLTHEAGRSNYIEEVKLVSVMVIFNLLTSHLFLVDRAPSIEDISEHKGDQ